MSIQNMINAGMSDEHIRQAARFRRVMFTTKEQWLKDQAYYAFKARHWAAMDAASSEKRKQALEQEP